MFNRNPPEDDYRRSLSYRNYSEGDVFIFGPLNKAVKCRRL
jgi:hypothetical protein